jgi:hypothetical protein
MLLGIIIAHWQRPVASSEALDLLYLWMRVVMYQRIAMAIKMAALQVYLLIVVCMPVTLVAAGAIRSKWEPNAVVQWLLE